MQRLVRQTLLALLVLTDGVFLLELVVNQKTAQALGLTLARLPLRRADEAGE